jgi:methylmalonyl-CoA decarboxylase
LLNEFIDALDEFKEKKARVIIIRAPKGSKVFSSGFDINELPEAGKDPLPYSDPLEIVIRKIQEMPAPVIAMIEGSVWGGACDMCFVCDLLIGTHSCSFAITPAKIGLPYNTSGILHFINQAGLAVAKEMFFTAQPMSAEQAKNLGILNHLVPVEVLEEFTYKTAAQIKENSPLSIAAIKEQIRILSSCNPLYPQTFERIQGLRKIAYESHDYSEGKRAFLEKRKPVFTGN